MVLTVDLNFIYQQIYFPPLGLDESFTLDGNLSTGNAPLQETGEMSMAVLVLLSVILTTIILTTVVGG